MKKVKGVTKDMKDINTETICNKYNLDPKKISGKLERYDPFDNTNDPDNCLYGCSVDCGCSIDPYL